MYFDIRLNEQNLYLAERLIPYEYRKQVLAGELFGLATYEERDADAHGRLPITAAALFRWNKNWLEIVWAACADGFTDNGSQGIMVHYLDSAHREKGILGAYAECSEDEVEFREMLSNAGFTIDRTTSNVYEFQAGMIQIPEKLPDEASKKSCTLLMDADRVLRGKILNAIKQDPREIPFTIPANWEIYDGRLSVLYVNDDKYGAFLVSENDGFVSLDMVMTQDVRGFVTMGSVFLEQFQKICEPELPIIAPVINEEARLLVERLAPDAKRSQIYQAYLRF